MPAPQLTKEEAKTVARAVLEQLALSTTHEKTILKMAADPSFENASDDDILANPGLERGFLVDFKAILPGAREAEPLLARLSEANDSGASHVAVGAAIRAMASEPGPLHDRLAVAASKSTAMGSAPGSAANEEGISSLAQSASMAFELSNPQNLAEASKKMFDAAAEPSWPPKRVDLTSYRERNAAPGQSPPDGPKAQRIK